MTGRNDKCPCGSDKKYKTCCLVKDQAATNAKVQDEQREIANAANVERATMRPATTKITVKFSDPKMDAINARYDQFEFAGPDDQWKFFLKTMETLSGDDE